MRSLIYATMILLIVSCSGSGTGEENKQAARTEKVGKLEISKAEVKKFYFLVGGKTIEEAKIPYGSSVVLMLEGVQGFKETNGKVSCTSSIEVFDANNVSLVKLDSLFDKKYPEGMPVERFLGTVEMSLKCQNPLQINKTYKVVFSIKDKAGEAMVRVSENFMMVPSPGLMYEEKGLSSDGLFLYRNSADEGMSDNKLNAGDTLYAYCTGVNGLTVDNGMVRPDASIALYNQQGDVIVEFKDLYKEYEKDGASEALVKQLLSMQLVLPPTLQPKTKYYVQFFIGDKKSKNSLSARYDFVTN